MVSFDRAMVVTRYVDHHVVNSSWDRAVVYLFDKRDLSLPSRVENSIKYVRVRVAPPRLPVRIYIRRLSFTTLERKKCNQKKKKNWGISLIIPFRISSNLLYNPRAISAPLANTQSIQFWFCCTTMLTQTSMSQCQGKARDICWLTLVEKESRKKWRWGTWKRGKPISV